MNSSGPLSQRSENVCSHKNMNTYVLSSLICNSPLSETTQISFRERMFTQTVVHHYHGSLLSNTKNKLLDDSPKNYAPCKETSPKGHILYGFWNDRNIKMNRLVLPGNQEDVRAERMWLLKCNMRKTCGDGISPYLDDIHTIVLVLTLCYTSFASW